MAVIVIFFFWMFHCQLIAWINLPIVSLFSLCAPTPVACVCTHRDTSIKEKSVTSVQLSLQLHQRTELTLTRVLPTVWRELSTIGLPFARFIFSNTPMLTLAHSANADAVYLTTQRKCPWPKFAKADRCVSVFVYVLQKLNWTTFPRLTMLTSLNTLSLEYLLSGGEIKLKAEGERECVVELGKAYCDNWN